MKTLIVITIALSPALFARTKPDTQQAISKWSRAQNRIAGYRASAQNYDYQYQNCMQAERIKKHPNPYNCETFRIAATRRRAQAEAVQEESSPILDRLTNRKVSDSVLNLLPPSVGGNTPMGFPTEAWDRSWYSHRRPPFWK